jgi:glycosyltransferase involved in cell wall biosynthesis
MVATLSIVVPVYGGEAYLDELTAEIAKLREVWSNDLAPISLKKLVFVDDGAIDRSAKIIDQISNERPWVEAIHLSRNFGQHPATIAGILHTEEDWVVTLDEDLQHPPSRIPDLLRKAVLDTCDVVYGKSQSAIHEAASRDITSRAYKHLMEWVTGNKHIPDASSFRLLRGQIARGAAAACAHDVYFDVAVSWFTQRIQIVVMPLKDRRFIATKKSGYRFRTLVSHGRRLLVSSQVKALRLGALLGITASAISIAAGTLVFIVRIFWAQAIEVRGWTSLILSIIFFGGSILFMLGIALEYISILLLRSNGRPLFFEIDRSKDALLADYLRDGVKLLRETPTASSLQS